MLNTDKTQLLWAGSRHGPALLCSSGPSSRLGTETITANNQVRVLGVTLSLDLSPEKHVSNLMCHVLYWLRQLRSTCLTSTRCQVCSYTLVHAFVASRVDYLNVTLAGTTKSITDKLQRVLNAATRIVTGTDKYDHGLSHLLHAELHWLDVPKQVQYKLITTIIGWLRGTVVERRSLAGELSLSCARPAADE